ncbi:MAG TPA: ribose-5-phosphate isomerase [Actinomycetales bacterium]|nr:ribose-5-phosphate isomerase [Actinomycetales bacterium]
MRVHIGGDHAAYDLKVHLVEHLLGQGYDVVDHGPDHLDPDDDYPVNVLRAATGVRADEGSLGVVLGGSGNGEQIAANKVLGIRAALAWSEETARLAREHNDAQVVSIGARMHSLEEATAIVDAFLATSFSRNSRHERRLAMIARYEDHEELPPIVGSEG